MREFELLIDDALRKGLNPEDSILSSAPYLFQALGFRCGRGGLEGYEAGDNPLVPGAYLLYSWPFPQFIVGERYNFLVVRDTAAATDYVYSVSDDLLTITLIASIDDATYGTGWLMEVADFGEYVFMTNGVAQVYWTGIGAATVITSIAAIPLLGTVCNLKGQIIGGNAQSGWYDCDSSYYMWSNIGHNSFVPDIQNEAGYRRDPYGGTIYHTRRLGENAIGYSSEGVTLLSPVREPAATIGFVELADVGLRNRGAVGGNLKHQIYVGSDLIVREVSREGVKELGYRYWMEELDDDGLDIIVLHDKYNDDFYIGNSSRTFLLSPYGMTDLSQHPSAVWGRRSGHVYMLPDTVDAGFKPIVTTGIHDMGYKGLKTTFTMETDAVLAFNPYASVDWANDISTWGYGAFTPINNMGIATTIASANYFVFNVRFDYIYTALRLGYIRVRYKMTDMKSIRGIYAPSPRGQASAD